MSPPPLVSIIVPAYNVEGYIAECLESAVRQDYANYEVIVINDGSTDNSGSVIRRYERQYANLTLVETANQGLSNARNKGLSVARGDYVLFLDGDDYLELSAVSKSMEAMEHERAEVVFFSSRPFLDGMEGGHVLPQGSRDSRLVNRLMTAETFLLRSLECGNYMPSVCLYAFRRQLIENIQFLPGILHEDNLFTVRLLLENPSARVTAISDELFNRRVRPGSITTMKKTAAHAEGFLRVAECLSEARAARSELGQKASSWVIQHALKQALYALQVSAKGASLRVRMRALGLLFSLPIRHWRMRHAPLIILPDLLLFLSVVRSGKRAVGAP